MTENISKLYKFWLFNLNLHFEVSPSIHCEESISVVLFLLLMGKVFRLWKSMSNFAIFLTGTSILQTQAAHDRTWEKRAELEIRRRFITWQNANIALWSCIFTQTREPPEMLLFRADWFFEQVCKNIYTCICMYRMINKTLNNILHLSWNPFHSLRSSEERTDSCRTLSNSVVYASWNGQTVFSGSSASHPRSTSHAVFLTAGFYFQRVHFCYTTRKLKTQILSLYPGISFGALLAKLLLRDLKALAHNYVKYKQAAHSISYCL